MTQDWRPTTLKDLCIVDWGNTNLTKSAYIEDGEFLAVSAAGGDGRIGHKEHSKGTPVLSAIGAQCGRMFFPGEDFTAIKNTITLTPRTNVCDGKFLYYLLTFVDLPQRGAGQPFISKGDIQSFSVLAPPLPEQKRIAAILDEAFAGIAAATANAEKNLANARELFDGHLKALFDEEQATWERKTLRQAALDFGRGKSKHRPRNDPKLYGGKYPFIQTGDVRNCDHVILESTQTYSESGLAQSKLWPKGTICITIAANIAETGILGFDACFPDSVIGMVVDPKQTTNDFVEYLLRSVQAQLKAAGKGSAQDNINLATFEDRPFPFPELEEQARIVDTLNELSSCVRQLEELYGKKLSALAELKQAILQKAFSGELAVLPEEALQEEAA